MERLLEMFGPSNLAYLDQREHSMKKKLKKKKKDMFIRSTYLNHTVCANLKRIDPLVDYKQIFSNSIYLLLPSSKIYAIDILFIVRLMFVAAFYGYKRLVELLQHCIWVVSWRNYFFLLVFFFKKILHYINLLSSMCATFYLFHLGSGHVSNPRPMCNDPFACMYSAQ